LASVISLYYRFSIYIAFIISTIYILFLYLYSINLLISISYLLIFNLFLLSSTSRNIGRSFLKRLGGNKIRNRFIIRSSKAFISKSYNCRVNILGF
jgi:hypothetical protein